MSFVNDVMAEEAGRNSLILYEDSSVFQDAVFPPINDSTELKKKYWLNFLLALIVLITAIGFVDQLPASKSYSESKTNSNTGYSYTEKLELPVMSSSSVQEDVVIEDMNIVDEKLDKKPVPEKRILVQEVSDEKTPDRLKPSTQKNPQVSVKPEPKTEPKAEFKDKPILDLTSDKVVFNKKISNDTAQIKIDTQFIHTQKLLEQGDINSAITELKQVLILDDRHLDARLLLTSKLIDQGQVLEAIEVYKKGLLLTPEESRLAKPMAHLLVERGEIDQSLQVLQKAAPSANADPDYHSFIAALQQQTGRHGKAINIYQKILKSQPENGKWWLGLGISLMAEARDKEALAAFESSLNDQRVSSALKQFANQRIIDLKNNQAENRGRS